METPPLTLQDLVQILEIAISRSWADSGDAVGLQVGDPSRRVSRVWPVAWVTKEILRRAQRRKVDLLITYRPLPGSLSVDLRATSPERNLLRLLYRDDISVYSVATSINPHPHGPSRVLAERLGLSAVHAVFPKPQCGQAKIVTFVPSEHTDAVRSAMAKAGAGRIGEYESCSFRLAGEGSFCGSERAKPFIGEPGYLQRVPEERLEMVCPVETVPAVVGALRDSHPYEEAAYDVYVLHDVRDPRQSLWVGELAEPLSMENLQESVAAAFPDASPPESLGPNRGKNVRRIGCTAIDGSAMVPYLAEARVQAFICRGINDQGAWELAERGIPCLSLSREVLDDLFPASIRRILEPWKEKIRVL
jgi:hypothetical protein